MFAWHFDSVADLGTKDSIEYQCPFVENKDVLTVHMITKILYVQTESTKLTANWEKALRAAALYNGTHFEEMQLTTDDVPVIVHKCIDFLYAHGNNFNNILLNQLFNLHPIMQFYN